MLTPSLVEFWTPATESSARDAGRRQRRSDTRHDALDDTLHHAADRIRFIPQRAKVDRRKADQGCSQRHESERTNAYRLATPFTVDPYDDAHD
jgi:hypothetical protein